MTGEVKRHFRDRTWAMYMPRRLQELRVRLHAAREESLRDLGLRLGDQLPSGQSGSTAGDSPSAC